MDTVGGEEFNVGVVDEGNTIHVYYTEVRSVCLNLANVDHFVHIILALARHLKRSCNDKHQSSRSLDAI